MFARQHPMLFFFLMFALIVAITLIILSLLFSWGFRGVTKMGQWEEPEGEKIGIVEVRGPIIASEMALRHLKEFRDDEAIKAVVVRIDSPGGGVGASQEIYQAVKKTAGQKPVVVSMGGVAASGGYYIASAAPYIMANPGTITGSIGVIMGYTNVESLLEKIGVYPVVIKSGKYKDTGSPTRELTKEERQLLQGLSDDLHDQFIQDIADGRQMDESKVRAIANGSVFSGKTALSHGLVDRLGNLNDAVAWAGEEAGLTGKLQMVYPIEEPYERFLRFFEGSVQTFISNTAFSRLRPAYRYAP